MTSTTRPSLFGPLVWWELVRLARLGQATHVRILLLYVLLIAVVGFAFWWSYPASPINLFRGAVDPLPITPDVENQRSASYFTGSFALVLLEVQLLFVAVLTPAYAVAAIAEEKDRHTLPLLLTTALTDGEIVWGKMIARVTFILAAVAAGIPVVMLTLLHGGVDLPFIASGYALIAGTAVLSAAIGVSAGCHCPDVHTALVRAYVQAAILVGGLLLPPFVLLSPFAMLAYSGGVQGPYELKLDTPALRVAVGFGYPVGQAIIAWALMSEATRRLRSPGATAGPHLPTAYPEPPRGRPTPVVFAPPTTESRPLPPIDDGDPMLWKERHNNRTKLLPILATPALGGVVAMIAVALFVAGGWQLLTRAIRGLDPDEAHQFMEPGQAVPGAGGWMMTTAGVLAGGLYLLPLAVGVTGCVAGERHRGTLDSLLATPLPRLKILWSKLRARVEGGLVFGVGSVTAIGSGFGAEGGALIGLAAMAATVAGFWLVIGFGAWLSVRCATPGRAFRLCLPVTVGLIVLLILTWKLTTWNDVEQPTEILCGTAVFFALAGGVFLWRAGAELDSSGKN